MIIFPSIDLRDGQCVRLLRGDPNAQTVYSTDPVAIAEKFAETGAAWLHVVNLDGAFGDENKSQRNLAAIQSILDRIDIPIQVGGGIRSIDDIERLLDMGVTRIILGTIAVQRPRQVLDIIGRFGAKQAILGLDADANVGKVATHGWQTTSDQDIVDFGQQMAAMGVTHVVFTDISRDGTLEGANVEASELLADQTGMQVIVSGGVAGPDDIRRAKTAGRGIHGIIIGRALYTGDIDLAEALAIAAA